MAASQLLDEAREIARKRGKKLLDVLKEEAKEFFNSKPS
jgi:vacuolar-type H+-ATPase subunit H